MKKQLILFISIGVLYFLCFSGVFQALQQEQIYHATLGLVSENYERVGSWDHSEIRKVSKPFVRVQSNQFETWDAAIYKCISERMYRNEIACYGTVRGAFFPLFPLLWKAIHATSLGISILNYFLFILSVALLGGAILKTSSSNHACIYLLLISLPSTVIFSIPYTEALFILTFTLAAIGLLRKKYWVFFIGCFLLAMVRPATVFVLAAIIAAEVFVLLKTRNYRLFVKQLILKTAPFAVGYSCTFFIQYLSSGSWKTMVEAQKHWSGGLQPVAGISDWSVEGFALSSFAIFFVCIPLILVVGYVLIRWNSRTIKEYTLAVTTYDSEYLFIVSSSYLIGIFVFILMAAGGNLHSFFRFTLASPPFYIVVMTLLNYLSRHSPKKVLAVFAAMAILLSFFLYVVEYGGERMSFSFVGLYLFIATSLFLLIMRHIPPKINTALALVLVLLNTVWNAYLLNAFLSNGWVFT